LDYISNLIEALPQYFYKQETQQNNVPNNQYIIITNSDNDSNTRTVNRVISNPSITEIKNNLSFAYFNHLCESNAIDYVTKELTRIQETYDYNQYKEWLLTKITVVTKLNPYYSAYNQGPKTMDHHMSPIEYAVEKKNFNIAKQLIELADLKQRRHNYSNFIQLLVQEYLAAIKKTPKPNYKQANNIQDIMVSLAQVYINKNMNILELIPIFVNTLENGIHDFSYSMLRKTVVAKIENNCQDEIKLLYENINNNNEVNKTVKKAIASSILSSAIQYKNIDLIMMVLELNSELFFANNNSFFSDIAKNINDYGLMKKCLEYIVKNKTFNDFLVTKYVRGGNFCCLILREIVLRNGTREMVEDINPARNLLNCCIKQKCNDSALAIIVHGINIKFYGNEDHLIGKEKVTSYYPVIDRSQLALIMAIKFNNINMLKILIGLDAKQCSTDDLTRNIDPLASDDKRKEIINILDNPLPEREKQSIKFAYNLLKDINYQSNINLASIKQYIKEHDLFSIIDLSRVKSIEDLFLLPHMRVITGSSSKLL
jgi:hypothetical protein